MDPSDAGYDFAPQFLKMILGLGATLVLLFLVMYLLRRFYRGRQAFGNQGSSIQILERRPLSPKASLYLLEVEGHTLLIGLSSTGIHRVAQFPNEEVDLSWALENKETTGVK